MKTFACLLLIISVAYAKPQEVNPLLSKERIADINSKAKTWKAGQNFDETTSMSSLKKLVGVLPPNNKRTLKVHTPPKVEDIPESFDAREKWPECQSIKMLRDQSNCGSCWAFGAVEAMSDRICIRSGQTRQKLISAEYLIACCATCGLGCNGGWPIEAWYFWREHGIVTGGLYNTTDGCQAYSMPPCQHHTEGNRPACNDFNGGDVFPTPECRDYTCDDDDSMWNFFEELTYGHPPYLVRGEENIKIELMTNGPLEVDFDVYDDFLSYKSGVYQVTPGSIGVGGHAVKLIGWGVEEDVPYWLIANSWNDDWGEHGFFRIIRGQNEAGIESHVFGAIPFIW